MIVGRVIHGDGMGKSQGYATANLDLEPAETPPPGCYAATVRWRQGEYPAALIVGSAPGKVEVHLIDYAGADFYGEEMQVEPGQKVSETMAVDSAAALNAKMDEDLRQIRIILKI